MKHECQPLSRGQGVENDEESQPDRIRKEGLSFGIDAALAAHHRVGHAQAGGLLGSRLPSLQDVQAHALVTSIGLINMLNRVNAATRQVGGDWIAQLPILKNM